MYTQRVRMYVASILTLLLYFGLGAIFRNILLGE